MTKRAHIVSGILLFAAFGCAPPATEQLLEITFGSGIGAPPIQLDVDCSNGGCAEAPTLTGLLTYNADVASSAEDHVEILQYRIDYQLTAPNDLIAMPYFAGHLAFKLPVGESAEFSVAAAADQQRDFIRTRLPGQAVAGVATLMLGGYDLNNEQVFPRATFEVFFGDFVVGGEP